MSTLKNFFRCNHKANQTLDKIKMRSHLNADALFALIREDLQKVTTTGRLMHRSHWTTR